MYETGRALINLGAILAYDMTVECIYAKLSYLLGKKYSISKVKMMMMKNLKGELTDIKKQNSTFTMKNSKMVQAVSKIMNVTNPEDIKEINQTLAPLLVNSVTNSGNLTLLGQLAAEGADFNFVDYRGRGPLHIASMNGNLEIVEFLVEQRVNLDFVDSLGFSALYLACFYRRTEVVEYLVSNGATLIVGKRRLEHLLCQAGCDGDLEFLKLLHMCEVDINLCDSYNRNCGHLAACEDKIQILSFLSLETNFDFDKKDNYGNSTWDEIKNEEAKEVIKNNVAQRGKQGK